MKSVFHAAVIFLVGLSFSQVKAEKSMRMKINEINVWSDNVFVSNNVTTGSGANRHMNITVNVLQTLHNVDVHVEGQINDKHNPDYFLTLNTTINACQVLLFNSKTMFGSIVIGLLNEYGKFFDKCPINKGLYYLHKVWMFEGDEMNVISEVDFNFKFSFDHKDAKNKKTLMAKTSIRGEMVMQDV